MTDQTTLDGLAPRTCLRLGRSRTWHLPRVLIEGDRMSTDRTPKPCNHKHARHQHGTHACYVRDKCRCEDCTNANREYERGRTRRNAYGRSNLTDAEPVRERLRELSAAGIGLKQVTRLTGIKGGTLSKIMYGVKDVGRPPCKRVTKATAAKILALDPSNTDLLAGGARVESIGTRRRLQALIAIGWSQHRLAKRLGMQVNNLNALIHSPSGVRAATAKTVSDLYDELWDQPPTCATGHERAGVTRAVKTAAAYGWAPPLAWDDAEIDDPAAVPDLGTRENPRRHLHIDAIEDAIAWGYDLPGAAMRLGFHKSAIEVTCARNDRRDLLERLHRNAIGREAS